MDFFLNSCNLNEIQEIYDWGILDGVTMNPTMLSALKGDFRKNFENICKAVPVRVFAQVVAPDAATMVKEAKIINSLGDNVVVKVQTSVEGLKATRILKDTTDIEVCNTAIHSVLEAIAAAKAGADHVAIFLGLLGEADERPVGDLMEGIISSFQEAQFNTKIMTAGRSLQQLAEGFSMGAHEMTASYKLWRLMMSNFYTLDRWASFQSDWNAAFGDRNWITG